MISSTCSKLAMAVATKRRHSYAGGMPKRRADRPDLVPYWADDLPRLRNGDVDWSRVEAPPAPPPPEGIVDFFHRCADLYNEHRAEFERAWSPPREPTMPRRGACASEIARRYPDGVPDDMTTKQLWAELGCAFSYSTVQRALGR